MSPVYVFIGKLLSCLAKRKTISAICVPACILCHRYTYSSVNSCPALRNEKPYLQYVFPRVAKRIHLVTHIAMVFEWLLFSCHSHMHILCHRYTYSSVNSCPALRNEKPYLQYVFPRVTKNHICNMCSRVSLNAYTWSHILQWFLFLGRTANVYRLNSIPFATGVTDRGGS